MVPLLEAQAMAELGRLLVYELSKGWLPTMSLQLQTPMGDADGTIIDPSRPVKVRLSAW